MNGVILDNLNSKVQPTDTLYFLGDFAFGDKTKIPSLREQIKCRNILYIFGNHDDAIKKYYHNLFSSCMYYYELKYNSNLLCCFHYPIASWNEMHHGSINCYGHCHDSFESKGRQIDVGVDALNFQPISIDEVLEKMSEIDCKSYKVDHHS
jgi:calcineurin-like phosphoesterase family protein